MELLYLLQCTNLYELDVKSNSKEHNIKVTNCLERKETSCSASRMYSNRGPRIKKHCPKGLSAPNTSALEHGKCRNVMNCGGGSFRLTHGISKSYVLE